jgi:lipopolysaccharide export system protein LptA
VRLTIERLRTLVLLGGALLVIALTAFLVVAHFRNRFNLREIPKRLGANIQQEANGVTYTQEHGGHTLFKIHASKVVQLKQGGQAILHGVEIELYGEDGARVDRISGGEFEYDQKVGIAKAQGPVEITLMQPGEAPAVAARGARGRQALPSPLTGAGEKASLGEIQVKTSGLIFNQKSGIATTTQKVEFTITQGSGSSIGAIFDSENGRLVLDRDVQLDIHRGPDEVVLRARHAEFERDNMLCRMQGAHGEFRGGEATAGQADLRFRTDGSAVRLDASDGFSIVTPTSARIAAPRGTLDFDEHNQPRRGRLEGGATMDSARNGMQMHGAAPTADLAFTAHGLLRHAHLERGVTLHSEEATSASGAETVRMSRDWSSPVADANFRTAGKGQVDLASVIGTGGVLITSRTQRGHGPVIPSRMAAEEVTATFGAGQALTRAVATGHASLEETTASGAVQTTSGDRIEASFGAHPGAPAGGAGRGARQEGSALPGQQIQSATIEGNVVLVQQPSPRAQESSGAGKGGAATPGPLRATAGRAVYESAGEWVHLTIHPRVEDGGMQLSADKVDVSQESGDAFAHGHVKATWLGATTEKPGNQGAGPGITLGGQGPAHVVANEVQLHQATGEATFRGEVRLWQEANSISAPVIVLNKDRETLVARTSSADDPVRVVMLSAGGAGVGANGLPGSPRLASKDGTRVGHGGTSVLRVRGGDLKYSEAERMVVMHGAAAGNVVADTGSARVVSKDLELVLLPPGNHAGPEGGAAQVDRIVASGNVTVSSQGRRGVGDRLVYSSETGEYVLTGNPANPPTLMDPGRGRVSGASLIFNSRDDSVSIEGGGRKTVTETVAPK